MSDDKPQVSGEGAPESPSETPEGKPPQDKAPQAEAPKAESAAPAKTAEKSASAKPKKRKRWGRRLVLALPVLAVAYVVFGFFGVPLVVRHVGLPMAKKYFAGDIEIEAIRFNPLTFVAGADGIVVTDPGDPSEPIAKVDGFAADFDLWSVFKGEADGVVHPGGGAERPCGDAGRRVDQPAVAADAAGVGQGAG